MVLRDYNEDTYSVDDVLIIRGREANLLVCVELELHVVSLVHEELFVLLVDVEENLDSLL